MTDRGRAAASFTAPVTETEWRLADEPDSAVVDRLEEALRLPRPLCRLLAVRDLSDTEDAKRYLRPSLTHLHPHDTLTDIDRAASRICRAIRDGERILVHGDYDVDGMCSTALLVRCLRGWGADVDGFVPHRSRDGYDFGERGLEVARADGASLVVTTDCGIVAHETIARAAEQGIDVIVTDHHRPGERLPAAHAVVNPNRDDCTYPNPALSGAGVAFKLGQAVASALGEAGDAMHPFLDLVALATVADLVPLSDENRVLVREGLRRFPSTPNAGLRALLDRSGTDVGAVDGGTLGWVLAPRLNAVGRMGDAIEGLRLLLTDDPAEAGRLADRLEEENRRRREVEQRILEEALDRLESSYDPARDRTVVLASEGWHPGVIGIVASRLVERVHRPVVLIALDGNTGRGSARSIRGFNLFEAVQTCADTLIRFGGHEQAAGMDLHADRVEDFRACFEATARESLSDSALRRVRHADLEIELAEVTDPVVHYLRYFGPFGISNRKPVFLARSVRVAEGARTVGRGHLKLHLESESARVEGIGFGMAEHTPPDEVAGRRFDVLFQLQMNEYRGQRTVQARLVDLRPESPS